jgi:hypothetical protein
LFDILDIQVGALLENGTSLLEGPALVGIQAEDNICSNGLANRFDSADIFLNPLPNFELDAAKPEAATA